jgi:hypothetical protein
MNEEAKYKIAYEKATEELRDLAAKLEKWKKPLTDIETIKTMFPDLAIVTSCGLQVGQVQGALIHLNDLTDMRDATPVAKALTAMGYHTKGFEDFAEFRRRTYDYGDIKLMCFLTWAEGSKCRFVEVGKEEKPIFKLMCDGAEVLE